MSGEDTVTGLARLPVLLELNKPDVVIIELGGNDGLRAYQLEKTRDNLDKMISLAKKKDIAERILLTTNGSLTYI